jgi:hypothetical protein
VVTRALAVLAAGRMMWYSSLIDSKMCVEKNTKFRGEREIAFHGQTVTAASYAWLTAAAGLVQPVRMHHRNVHYAALVVVERDLV